tara:strand:+ start:1782 stop:4250 length:2469 start_codon:yes stop_codon:yes gene_type:complete
MTSRGGLATKRGTFGNIRNTGPIETEEVKVGQSTSEQTIIKKGDITSVGGTATLNNLVVSGTATFTGTPTDIQTENLVVKDPTIALGAISSGTSTGPDDTNHDRGLLFHYKDSSDNSDKMGFFGMDVSEAKYYLYTDVSIDTTSRLLDTSNSDLGNLKLGEIEATGINLSNGSSNGTITNLADPTDNQQAATKKYVDDNASKWSYKTSTTDIYYNDGKVGIGTDDPVSVLHCKSTSPNYATFSRASNSEGLSGIRIGGTYATGHDAYCSVIESYNDHNSNYNSDLRFKTSYGDHATATERMRIKSNGKVGIGTNDPYHPLVVMGPDHSTVSGVSHTAWSYMRYTGGPQHNTFFQSYWQDFSLQLKADIGILCEGGNIIATRTGGQSAIGNTVGGYVVAHWGFLNSSDERIKYDIEDVNDSSALEKLRELKPKTYKYRDHKGLESGRRGTVYGFIAQEVNSVFPEAVRILGKEHVPNIQEVGVYSSANKTITFTNFDTSGIPTSGVIKVITAKKEWEYLDINYISIIDSHTIEVETDISEHCGAYDEENEEFIAGNNIYVEGCEVPDFHLLKKESIFTLATAALQEVDRQLQAEKRAKAISRHRSFLNKNGEAYASGMIVSSTGTYVNSDSTIKAKINEALAFCKLTDTEKDKGVFGVLAEKNADGVIYKNEERWCINHGGKGGIWVCNKNGGLTNGDYITSSSVPGYGMKQSSDIKRNYTVAKISCNCDFNLTKVAKQKLRTQILTDTDGNDYTGLAYGTSGDVQFDDDLLEGELQMDYEYETRFLEADGTIIATEAEYTTKLNSGDVVFVACFVGCSYCCG